MLQRVALCCRAFCRTIRCIIIRMRIFICMCVRERETARHFLLETFCLLAQTHNQVMRLQDCIANRDFFFTCSLVDTSVYTRVHDTYIYLHYITHTRMCLLITFCSMNRPLRQLPLGKRDGVQLARQPLHFMHALVGNAGFGRIQVLHQRH